MANLVGAHMFDAIVAGCNRLYPMLNFVAEGRKGNGMDC